MTAYVDFVGYAKTEISNNKTPVFTIIDSYIARENNIFTKVLGVINNNLKKDIVDSESYPKECALVDKKRIKALISDIESVGKYDTSYKPHTCNLKNYVNSHTHSAQNNHDCNAYCNRQFKCHN